MATPVPIPNTAVKHLSADNTWLETARESRSLPDLYESLKLIAWGFVYVVRQHGRFLVGKVRYGVVRIRYMPDEVCIKTAE